MGGNTYVNKAGYIISSSITVDCCVGQVLKATENPVWSETFEFPVHEEEFQDK